MATNLVRQRLASRFKSPYHPRSQTRQTLRVLLRHMRSGEPPAIPSPDPQVALSDEEMLALLDRIEIHSGCEAATAQAVYQNALPPSGGEPSWSDVVTLGWVRKVWGRYYAHYDLYNAAGKSSGLTALHHWMAQRYSETVTLRASSTLLSPKLEALAADLLASRQELRHVTCRDPAWVAGRLWDRNWQSAASAQDALRVWVDQWEALGSPRLTPLSAWAAQDLEAFREAAFAVLENEPDIMGWPQTRDRFVRQAARVAGVSDKDCENFFDPMPQGWVQRASWLRSNGLEGFIHHGIEAAGALVVLATLLWADVLAEPHSPAPHPLAVRLLDLAQDRPELAAAFIGKFERHPELLADVLLHPPSTGLACLVFARAPWELANDVVAEDVWVAKVSAFSEVVGIMVCMIANGEVPSSEGADLLAWFHENAPPGFVDTNVIAEPMRVALASELRGLPEEAIADMIVTLIAKATAGGLESGPFAAALELAEGTAVSDTRSADAMAGAYIADLSLDRPQLRTDRIGIDSAKAFLKLPFQLGVRQLLLGAVDVRARNASAPSDHNPIMLERQIATVLRMHIRILSRAVIGYGTATTTEVIDALVDAVEAGVEVNPAKGRVSAFAPHFETESWSQDRPIAEDLAGALRALDEPHRGRLLGAVLRTDEPYILARLYPHAMPSLRGEIEKRLNDLTPGKSAEVFSLRDLQARAESLLAAGLAGPASAHLGAERDAKPMGTVPGRKLVQLRADLRLKFLAEDWDGIVGSTAPADLPQLEHDEARDSLEFYKGLALLLDDARKPGGAEAAEQIFASLLGRKPHIRAYALNLFAAQVTGVLSNDAFALLDDAAAKKARRLILENDRAIGNRSTLSADEHATLAANETILLLALNEPAQAFATITQASVAHSDPKSLGYQAVALSRLGREAEAETVLKTAESLGASTQFVEAVRAHLSSGLAVSLTVQVSEQEDRVRNVRAALFDLLNMDADEQAKVLGPSPSAVETYLTDQLSQAAASLTKLVSVMRAVVISDCEDDLNAILGELLLSRLHLIKWAVPDQSKGGHSGGGNPGERDLVVRRDAAELCLIEAVICEHVISRDTEQKNLRKHFQKLFGYGTSRTLFYVTYAYGSDLGPLRKFIIEMAEKDGPVGYELVDWTDLSTSDSRPDGIKARYRVDGNEATVVFLILNLGQVRERAAALQART